MAVRGRLAVLVVALAAASCWGGSTGEVDRLEARVADLERQVSTLEQETAKVRALERKLDSVERYVERAKGALGDLDRLRELLDRIAAVAGIGLG